MSRIFVRNRFSRSALAALLLALLAGCGELLSRQPVIESFTASSLAVTSGQSVVLSWQASNFDTLTLNPDVGDVTGLQNYTVRPTATTTYTLTATQDGVQRSQSLEVRVGDAPTIQSFTASPNPVSPGQTATLAWLVEGATSLEIDQGVGVVTGQSSATVTAAQDTAYTLTARNDFGEVRETVLLEVGDGPTIQSFTITPDKLTAPGGEATLAWSVTGEGAVDVLINRGVGSVPASGSRQVTVTNSDTFTLTATDRRGTRTATVTVVVGAPPTVSLTVTPSTIREGESATLNWSVSGQEITSVRLEPGIGAVAFTDAGASGSRQVSPRETTTYTLTAESGFGTARETVRLTVFPAVPSGNITFLIAGQSNAVGQGELTNPESPIPQVRMLGNDYVWKTATEPVDSNEGQLDSISRDTSPGHSFGVTLGKALFEATGNPVYLIPSARGGSCLTASSCGVPDWTPSGPTDRSTLFGSAVYRARVSAGLITNNPPAPPEGGPVDALLWYQGESDAYNDARKTGFISNTTRLMSAFRNANALGNVPIIYAQIGLRRLDPTRNLEYQEIRERQRKMETGYGEDANRLTQFYMVVTHDLPMVDQNHLDAAGQKELGRRIALAYLERVLGFPIDGTGPRLVSIEMDAEIPNAIKVKTTQAINATDNKYDGYFTIYANRVPLSSGSVDVTRHPSDDTAVLLSFPSGTTGTLTVSYAPPTNRALGEWKRGVVQGPSGLPLPAFGDATVGVDGEIGLPVPYAAGAP